MNEQKLFSIEFKVGLTVIIATFILVFGIIWGKEYRLETDKYHLQVLFDNVGGLVVGDPVTVNGVREGKIKQIDWQNRLVLCTLEINNHVQLYEDASFTVQSAELLSGMKVEIHPGRSDKNINKARQPFTGKYGGQVVDITPVIKDLSMDIARLTRSLDSTVTMINTTLKDGDLQANVTNATRNFERISARLDHLIAVSGDDLSESIRLAQKSIRDFNQIMEANKGSIEGSIKGFNQIMLRLDSLSISMQQVMKQIESRQGTLSHLIYDSTLHIQLKQTLHAVDSLAKQIKNDGLDLNFF
jgi:phospholipid/cholesterol/gamma-HCH transport system substrate-binding protein